MAKLNIVQGNFAINGQLVSFLTEDKIILHGFFVPSRKSKKVFIHIPGMTSNFYDDFRFPYLVRYITKSGYNFFQVNNRGHDVIADIPNIKGKWIRVGTVFEKFEDCLKDIKAAIDFASRKEFTKIVLSGHSTGCQKITYYQSKVKDKRVKGLILIAPTDDYNYVTKKEFGKNYPKIWKIAKQLINSGKENELMPKETKVLMSAKRFLSDADLKNIEARIFNYDSKMEIFSKIKCPILAIFGTKEQYAVKSPKAYLEILKVKTKSKRFDSILIKNANHSFIGKEGQLAKVVANWLKRL